MSGSDQEALRNLVVELRILEGTADILRSRLNFVNVALNELNTARTTLEGVEKEKPNASLFVPIGAGSYIKAKLKSVDQVIVGMGAGVSIERSLAEAKQSIQTRIGEFEKTRVSLQQQLMQVIGKIQEDRNRLQDLTKRLNATGRGNVQKAEGRLQRTR